MGDRKRETRRGLRFSAERGGGAGRGSGNLEAARLDRQLEALHVVYQLPPHARRALEEAEVQLVALAPVLVLRGMLS